MNPPAYPEQRSYEPYEDSDRQDRQDAYEEPTLLEPYAPRQSMHPVVLAGHTLANNNSLPTLAPAQLCNAVLAAQSIEHNPNLVLGRKVPSARPSDIPDHLLGGLLRLRGFRRHSGSFVFQTRPELSLNLKPNSVPRALMPDRCQDHDRGSGDRHRRAVDGERRGSTGAQVWQFRRR